MKIVCHICNKNCFGEWLIVRSLRNGRFTWDSPYTASYQFASLDGILEHAGNNFSYPRAKCWVQRRSRQRNETIGRKSRSRNFWRGGARVWIERTPNPFQREDCSSSGRCVCIFVPIYNFSLTGVRVKKKSARLRRLPLLIVYSKIVPGRSAARRIIFYARIRRTSERRKGEKEKEEVY